MTNTNTLLAAITEDQMNRIIDYANEYANQPPAEANTNTLIATITENQINRIIDEAKKYADYDPNQDGYFSALQDSYVKKFKGVNHMAACRIYEQTYDYVVDCRVKALRAAGKIT